MSARQLALLLVAALVLSAAGWLLFHRGASSWESAPISSTEKILDFPLNDVAQLTIRDGTGELHLLQKDDAWVVRERAEYPADFEQVSRLLQKIWNLKPVQTVQAGPSQFGRLELVEPAQGQKGGVLVELKNKDQKRIAGLLAGKQYLRKSSQSFGPATFPAGRYVMPMDGSKRVYLIADPLQDLVTKPERWLDHDFIKIEKPKTITLEGETAETQWKMERESETAGWTLANSKPGEEIDETKATGVVNTLAHLAFADVLDPNATPDATGLDHPKTLTIETFGGLVYSLKLGKLAGESYPLTVTVAAESAAPAPSPSPNEEMKTEMPAAALAKAKKFQNRPFLINKFSVDQLLKKRADLAKPPPAPSPSPSPSPGGKASHTPAPTGRP